MITTIGVFTISLLNILMTHGSRGEPKASCLIIVLTGCSSSTGFAPMICDTCEIV